ncbi:MAG: hypothetical protein BA868_06200 [Desulfobacterales bacterium C00003106]|jgi:hypothetical protein|nr:hypothetical protein [Desulfobacterales bacterium]OEU54371.1 MAG: hypothetical protein BA868_06200 [Desulfobacterales bacterium C00003106]OEU60574.1 MAG: hypothetical protein BAW33_07470 [Desulfobacterales bacterium C00003104]
MKQYLIDELRPDDYKKIKDYFNEAFGPQPVDGMYWIPIDPELMDSIQLEHAECQPFYYAVLLEPTSISFELLIRSRNRMRCACIHYADKRQRDSIVEFADSVFERLKLTS